MSQKNINFQKRKEKNYIANKRLSNINLKYNIDLMLQEIVQNSFKEKKP